MIKNKLPKRPFSTLLIIIMLLVIGPSCVSNPLQEDETLGGGCSILPKGFSDSDLVGIWVSGSHAHPRSSDILVIRSDGTYKQLIQLEYPSIEYESDWQSWWFEYRDNGTGYLHLDDYRGCAASTERSCDWVNGGEIPWADLCEGQWMDPGPRAGEIILVVHGIPGISEKNKSHPFVLTLFNGFESSPWTYGFLDHDEKE